MLKIAEDVTAPYQAKLITGISGDVLTVQFLINSGIFYQVHQNAFLLKLRAVWDYSEPTIAIQSVLDAAFLGDERLVREGLSKRLLAELEQTGKMKDAVTRLGKRTWSMNTTDDCAFDIAARF